MDDEREMGRTASRRKTASNLTFCVKKEKDGKYRKVYSALQKKEDDLTEEEQQLILNNVDLVKKARESLRKREEVKARSEEVEDPDDILIPKCTELAAALRNSRHLVVYTGAGISTAAKIPDYRGSNGIWTLLQQGKDIGKHDLSQAEPTLTHMALFELYSRGILKYVVSQNCDGLHLRSGLPRSALSEVHGNMHLEVCQMCRPSTQYWRMFDVTENTGRFTHRTMRRCHLCHSALIDTIVHFGERGNLPWPLNWPAANKAADNADTILCIGSSLKVLKKYPWLFGMDKPVRKRPKLYIINLQWTPKDDHAVLKINGRCDRVMQEVMKLMSLQIPEYSRLRDPIFCHATHLHPDELHTTSQRELDSLFKKEETNLEEENGVLKQNLKRNNSGYDADCPTKVRKMDCDSDVLTDVKKEFLNVMGNDDPRFSAFSKFMHDENDALINLSKSRSSVSENSSALKIAEGHMSGRSKFVLKDKEVKQEALDEDQFPVHNQSSLLGGELLTSCSQKEEVVDQTNICEDVKNSGVSSVHSKDDCASTLNIEKKVEEVRLSILSSGLNSSGSMNSDAVVCSKVNVENITADISSIDGKENVAVCVSKGSAIESTKALKKVECEKTADIVIDSEKTQNIGSNTIQSTKNDNLLDNFGSLKGQKHNGKGNSEGTEDEVVVLKMLQLEHNYSKSSDDSNDSKNSDSKDSKQQLKGETKDPKKDFNSGSSETRRTLRRTSKDAVNYIEPDEEDLDDDEDDESEESDKQSACSSSRVKAKQSVKKQELKNDKLSKAEARDVGNNTGRAKKLTESSSSSSKHSKPSPPLKNKKLTKADFEMRVELKSRACSFCSCYYMSKTCLFYPSLDFRPRQFEGCICECCDYSSESEDAEEEGSNGETNEGKGDSTDNADECTSKSSIINPGWYGKGCRKRIIRKRK
ncbi:dentin sialophosphoprotein [Thrips palmi]|uniref:protein acetyllysine N-acetyltransferase n=1 Tax=Thrips palmi TaxID=161013 RepID=A0A6P8ZNP1_THRPL|nr:dentin sialophosphoprotein [Thrips palmi]